LTAGKRKAANPPLWYFAYGANMAASKLVVRGIAPTESQAAHLPDWALRFNHPGAPPHEPVFASIDPQPGATVYGVAHAISPAEAAILDRFEQDYHRVPVTLHLAGGTTVAGFAYRTDQPCPEGIPSARYLGLLLEGARAYALPAPLIAHLEALLVHAPRESLDHGAHWEMDSE
jgi:hypothetical protein